MPDESETSGILRRIEQGDPRASSDLLPLVYTELRKLATSKMAQENPGHTLQATALVHEAYLRLVGAAEPRHWDGRGHFFAAAAEAMRQILVEHARGKNRVKHGAGAVRNEAFFLAMAHWRLGEKDKAREWNAKADPWMQKASPTRPIFKRFRAEAVELMGPPGKP